MTHLKTTITEHMATEATGGWRRRLHLHHDFLLLATTFITFRLAAVWFTRPGGYIRDYSDLIFYRSRASWQDFGFLPYRDYWSEYPPLFAWFSVWIDSLARLFPVWEDERFWYALFFGAALVAAESVTFVCLYLLAQQLWGERALRVAWLYAGLFLPVAMLSGWYDALPVMTIFVALTWLLTVRSTWGLALAGIAAGVGGALKLVPLAILAVTPLVTRRWRDVALAVLLAVLVVAGVYALAYVNGPTMTLASLRSLVDRTGWSTWYALADGFTRLGKVVGDPFDPASEVGQYDPHVPQRLIWFGWLTLGGLMLWLVRRRQSPPQAAWRVVSFAALTYAILLLAYPAWNPQYALYLLPFLVLIWPNGRGLLYALLLSAYVLLEHPVYFNLIGPNYPPTTQQILGLDHTRLLWVIVSLRTLVLIAIAIDLGWTLLQPAARRLAPVFLALATIPALLWFTPDFLATYRAGRLATTPLRPAIVYLNAQSHDLPVVASNLSVERTLRPLLDAPDRLILAGGRPERVEPLPALLDSGRPFVYVRTPDDANDVVAYLDASGACPHREDIGDAQLWRCHVDATPLAVFDDAIALAAVHLPDALRTPLYLTLFWRANAPPRADYTVFVHVVDASGNMIGQWDQPPAAGAAPTSSWTPGRIVVDDYRIELDLAAAQRPVRVLVGLYDPATGTRLPVSATVLPTADNAVEVWSYP
ncbi:MAG TPA: DUF2029 domain-containing protein [Chloroflexi bacterium]|nr:DUF2029 domain-containing protein [Chloroflexota bacterium]